MLVVCEVIVFGRPSFLFFIKNGKWNANVHFSLNWDKFKLVFSVKLHYGGDAVWVVGSDRLKEPCVRWGSRSPNANGQFWGGEGRPIVKYRDLLSWVVQKRLNRSRCRLGCWVWWAQATIYYRWGPDSPTERDTFRGVSGPLQSIGFWRLGAAHCKISNCWYLTRLAW